MGGGYNWLNAGITKQKVFVYPSGTDSINVPLKFRYISYYFDFVFYKTRHWEFSVPLQIGAGDSRFEYKYNGAKFVEDEGLVVLYESAIAGEYKLLKWFGLGAGIGYRLMIVNNRTIPAKFNSPVYDFNLVLYYSEILRVLFPRSKLSEKLKDE
jgi:hypothetical protein